MKKKDEEKKKTERTDAKRRGLCATMQAGGRKREDLFDPFPCMSFSTGEILLYRLGSSSTESHRNRWSCSGELIESELFSIPTRDQQHIEMCSFKANGTRLLHL